MLSFGKIKYYEFLLEIGKNKWVGWTLELYGAR